jgi:hypothetical protein
MNESSIRLSGVRFSAFNRLAWNGRSDWRIPAGVWRQDSAAGNQAVPTQSTSPTDRLPAQHPTTRPNFCLNVCCMIALQLWGHRVGIKRSGKTHPSGCSVLSCLSERLQGCQSHPVHRRDRVRHCRCVFKPIPLSERVDRGEAGI